jgi:hypothetical protein
VLERALFRDNYHCDRATNALARLTSTSDFKNRGGDENFDSRGPNSGIGGDCPAYAARHHDGGGVREPEMLTFLELNRDNSADVIHVNMSAVAHFERRGNSTIIEFLSEKVAAVSVRQTPEEIYDLMDKVPTSPGQ